MQPIAPFRSLLSRYCQSSAARSCRSLYTISAPRRPLQSLRCRPVTRTIASRRWNTSLVPESGVNAPPRPQEPSYQLTFTCKPCSHRSAHMVTKHGYHKGSILIKCPGCSNRHVISDHLKIFMDQGSTLEDILKRAAPDGTDLTTLLKKGRLGMQQGAIVGNEGDEDIEFWDDGSRTQHKPRS